MIFDANLGEWIDESDPRLNQRPIVDMYGNVVGYEPIPQGPTAIQQAIASGNPDTAYSLLVQGDALGAFSGGRQGYPNAAYTAIINGGGSAAFAEQVRQAAMRSQAANEGDYSEGTLEGMLSSGTEFAKEVAPLVLAAAATYGGASALGGALEGAAVGGGSASGGATGAVSGGFESPLAGVPRAPIAVSGPATAIGEGGALSTALPAAETLGLNFSGGLAGGALGADAVAGDMNMDLTDFDFSDLSGALEQGTPSEVLDIFGSTAANPGWVEGPWPGVESGAGLMDALSKYGTKAMSLAQKIFSGGADASTVNDLIKLGVPAALVAGMFEKNDSPLVGPMKQAAEAAYVAAGQFGALEGPGITPSQQMAIDQARMSSGAWRGDLDRAGALAGGSTEDNAAFRGYFDKAGALTDRATRETTAHKPYFDRAAQFADRAGALNDAGEADFARSRLLADESAGPVTEQMIAALMNPYLREVLDPAVRDVEEAAARRRQQLRSQVARSGNDFRTPGSTNRFNVEDDLLDATMLDQIGTLSGKLRYQGWDTASARAREDLARKGQASTLVGNVGRSRADVRGDDLRRYLADAELYGGLGKSAAGIEGDDLGRYLKGADVYGALGSKAGTFREGDLNRRATGARLYGDLAKTRGALDTVDIENLKTAGALERAPYEDRRANLADTAKLYTGVVHGTAPALNATTPDSWLTKGVGALGALKSAKDLGIY